MNQNRKFERAARSRQQLAIIVAIALHLAVFAAIIFQSEAKAWMPDFLKELMDKPAEPAPTAAIP
jgi:hypothetical protein